MRHVQTYNYEREGAAVMLSPRGRAQVVRQYIQRLSTSKHVSEHNSWRFMLFITCIYSDQSTITSHKMRCIFLLVVMLQRSKLLHVLDAYGVTVEEYVK